MSQVVHIVGGGLAGLAAAIRLKKFAFNPVILEKNNYFGGRVRSFVDKETGDEIDNGQHLLMTNCENLIHYIHEINASENIAIQQRLQIPFLEKNEDGIKKYTLQFPKWPYPFHLAWGLFRNDFFSIKDKLRMMVIRKISHANPDDYIDFTARDLLQQWKQSDQLIKRFWEPFLVSTLNSPLDVINGKLLIKILQETFLKGGKYIRLGFPVKGLSQVLVKPAIRFLMDKNVQLVNKFLIKKVIFNKNFDQIVALEDSRGNQIPVEQVLFSIPMRSLLPLLPIAVKEKLWQKSNIEIEYSPILSVHLWSKTPITFDSHLAFVHSPLHWIFNKRIYGGPHYSQYHVYQITISNAVDFMDRVPAYIEKRIKEELSSFFPKWNPDSVVRIKVIKEKYATPLASSHNEKLRIGPKTPIKNMYLAGDWTKTDLPYTMESAVLSGFRAADIIISKDYFEEQL